jgi:polar amino acid transport system substrate-binding protein
MKKWTMGTTFSLLALGVAGVSQAATPLKVCDDDGGWPPFTMADAKDPKKIVGANTEVIVDILKKAGYEPTIALLPWKRCLAEVESGETAMLMNAAANDERRQKYLLSKPLYTVSSGLFYMTSKFPTKPEIKTIAEMSKYKYCGLLGYNYKMYPIPDANLDSGAQNEKARFTKLNAGRCDFVIGDIEILKGFVGLLYSFHQPGDVALDVAAHPRTWGAPQAVLLGGEHVDHLEPPGVEGFKLLGLLIL